MKPTIRNQLLVLLVTLLIALPIDIRAKTIKEFENEVAQYTAELQRKKDKVAKNDAEVAEIKKKIAEIENQIVQVKKEIRNLEEEIERSSKEIEDKKEQSKKIMKYFQIVNGENSYLEYIFGATSITDIIYRISIVEQLTEYNKKIVKELTELIEKNKKQKSDLEIKNNELKTLQKSLEAEKERIDADSAAIRETMPSVETQIKEAKSNVEYFKKLGCGTNEDIFACQYRISQNSSGTSLPSVGSFSRPMQNGYIVRGYSGKNGHMGYDVSSNDKSIAIYPIASGSIHAIYEDACTTSNFCRNMGYSCNGNAKIVVVKHNYQGGYIYSSYVHLRSYGNVGVGQYVSKDTIIGYMGSTGCSTGPHLHLEVAHCHWKNNGGCLYQNNKNKHNSYIDRLINPSSLVNFPSRWNNR